MADPVAVRAQEMVPQTTREAVLGTVACSNPEILHRAVQSPVPETDSLKAPRGLPKHVHTATLSKPSQALPCEAEELLLRTSRRGLVAPGKSPQPQTKELRRRGEGRRSPRSLPWPPAMHVSEQTHTYPLPAPRRKGGDEQMSH